MNFQWLNNSRIYDSLDSETIKQFVYTNVNMMDEYLPGIIAVTKGEYRQPI